MRTAYLVTKPWLGTVEPTDLEFGQTMLGKFLGQLAERVAVGEISDMETIAGALGHAEKVITV